MNKRTLIVDSNYLCFRNMIALKGLSFEEQDTGVIFGFLRDIQRLATLFDYPKFIFAWDSEVHPSYREEQYPDYKKKKTEWDDEMLGLLKIGKAQYKELRETLLPQIGFLNQVIQSRLEADDMIAQVVKERMNLKNEHLTIISSDNDLYQLINDNVSMYDIKQKTEITQDIFFIQWGIPPADWQAVKALAGCSSDNVAGIPRIGIKTAIKWLREEKIGPKARASIEQNLNNIYARNLDLVALPHSKTQPIIFISDELSIDNFIGICQDYGMNSLIDRNENFKIWKKLL